MRSDDEPHKAMRMRKKPEELHRGNGVNEVGRMVGAESSENVGIWAWLVLWTEHTGGAGTQYSMFGFRYSAWSVVPN
jgi:hypothetical protein